VSGIVIIGAGECGIRAAVTARDTGYQGPITVIGEETALPYERPPLSKPDDSGAVEKPITTLEALSEKAIVLKCGVSAIAIKRDAQEVVLSEGGSLPYEKLLLATGSRPRPLNCIGGDRALVLRTIEDANAIYAAARTAKHVVIVGAGLIGLELAAELRTRNLNVTILEAGPRPLGRNVPEQFATKMALRHQGAGVGIVCNAQIASCTDSGVVLNDGRIFEADLIIAAIGVVPNTELAASAGLTTENGIRVDSRLMTDDPNIFAAGDCAAVKTAEGTYRRYETWQNAQAQGEVAGRNLAGGNALFDIPVWFWSDQYDLGLQGVGDTSGSPAAIRDLGKDAEMLFFFDDDGALVGAAGLGRGNAVAKDIKIAQRLIGVRLDAAALSDPGHNLKKLLRAA
jgi:3-phenylpropionate/trans-cinnamate dioxygenase ferredoxin reductase subunit